MGKKKKNQFDMFHLLFLVFEWYERRIKEKLLREKTDVVKIYNADLFAEVLTCLSVTTGHDLLN